MLDHRILLTIVILGWIQGGLLVIGLDRLWGPFESWQVAIGICFSGVLGMFAAAGQVAMVDWILSGCPRKQPALPCPYCGKPLLSHQAKQCFQCGTDWHDPNNVVKRG